MVYICVCVWVCVCVCVCVCVFFFELPGNGQKTCVTDTRSVGYMPAGPASTCWFLIVHVRVCMSVIPDACERCALKCDVKHVYTHVRLLSSFCCGFFVSQSNFGSATVCTNMKTYLD